MGLASAIGRPDLWRGVAQKGNPSSTFSQGGGRLVQADAGVAWQVTHHVIKFHPMDKEYVRAFGHEWLFKREAPPPPQVLSPRPPTRHVL